MIIIIQNFPFVKKNIGIPLFVWLFQNFPFVIKKVLQSMEVEDDNDDFDPPLPITNYFVYKGKKYPFNFSLFKIFSTVESEVTPNSCINLIEEDKCPIALSEDYIQYFVNYCQKIPIPKDKINRDSASTLHYLANYYKVKSLISRMEKYFKQNQQHLKLSFSDR